ncbi:MAG TPA: chromate efflux transporter [Rubrobacteraceae bacterium]|nr:chromate efflux transporter [Rubrobacteraceae bacterium]
MADEAEPGKNGRELRGLARLFLKLGTVAFGGPAAHIAMMREEVVERRRWMGEQEFLDLVGASSLIPGPNSTELAIHVGRVRAGWRGLLVAGACFILPAAVVVLVFAVLYVSYGSTPQAEGLLYGITPVVVAIIAHALWGFLREAVKGPFLAVVGATALALYFLGVAEIPLLFGGALIVLLVRNVQRWRSGEAAAFAPFGLPLGLLALSPAATGLLGLFLSFLKIGSVLFGSGYVLLAFLRSEFVGPGLLTDQQLLDAVAVGQVTPGPVFTTATFVGYVLAGVPGALLATVGIFLPAFVFVAVTGPLIPRLRESPVLAGLLDGANVVSLALMAGVTWQLGQASVVGPIPALIALATLALLFVTRLNPAWLVIGGGAVGLASQYLLG